MKDSMNQDKREHLAEIMRSLSENLLSNDFEFVMLRGLFALFRPSVAAFMSRKKGNGEDLIRVVELREDGERTDMISGAECVRRYGFSVSYTTSVQAPLFEGFSEIPGKVVIPFTSGDCHSLIHMAGMQDTENLSQECIALLQSMIELALNARCSTKKAMGSMNPDRGIGLSAHRIKTALSSIHTATDMLTDQDLSENDTEELKKLVQKGVVELTELIDMLLQLLHLNDGGKR
jgi:hypothetical protein